MTFRGIFLSLCALVFLVACQQQSSTGSQNTASASNSGLTGEQIAATEQKAASCRSRGGKWVRGLAGGTCAKKLKDAGKSCSSSKQCEGSCLANGRVCSPTKPFFGCHTLYENGKTARLCED